MDSNTERTKQQLEKPNAMPSSEQIALRPVKAKESKAVLYTLLGTITLLLLAEIILLAGIWLKSDNTQSNITAVAPTTVPSTNMPSNANTISMPKWEYKEIDVFCPGSDHCQVDGDISKGYPNRTAVLNEFAKQGWEVIYFGMANNSYGNIYGLRRPIIEK
jgi:hypothetical protein